MDLWQLSYYWYKVAKKSNESIPEVEVEEEVEPNVFRKSISKAWANSPTFLATCYETENKHATSIIGKQKNYIIKE